MLIPKLYKKKKNQEGEDRKVNQIEACLVHLDKVNFYRIPYRWYLDPAGIQHVFPNVDASCWMVWTERIPFL